MLGEYIRSDLRETQTGVPLIIDGQFLDTTTCEPIQNLYWDIWNCNSTGVYGGINANGNGNTADTTNIDKTFLRGLQPTDANGVAQFTTLFPGHYTGRTTHIHVAAHIGGTILSNGTYTGGKVSHIGQAFFDQSLITQVESLSPYTTNKQTLTTNAADSILLSEVCSYAAHIFSCLPL